MVKNSSMVTPKTNMTRRQEQIERRIKRMVSAQQFNDFFFLFQERQHDPRAQQNRVLIVGKRGRHPKQLKQKQYNFAVRMLPFEGDKLQPKLEPENESPAKNVEESGSKFKKHKCTFCTMEFIYEDSLNEHLTMHVIPFKCAHCSQSFPSARSLVQHEPVHADLSKCNECGKQCRHPNHLRTHQKVHTLPKKFKCDKCHYAFARCCDLKRHIQRYCTVLTSC